MKKLINTCITVGLILTLTSFVYAADNAVKVELDGENVVFGGQQPVIVNGRTLIPLRGVFEKMGYAISWEGSTKTATLKSGSSAVSVTANNQSFIVNGDNKPLDVPAQIMNGSMMLPLRAVGEAAGAEVTWNGSTKTVEINTQVTNVNDLIKISNYLVKFSEAVAPIENDGVSRLFDEMKQLDGEITADDLQGYRVRLYSAANSVEAVSEAVKSLEVPDSMSELQAVRLEALDKMTETINVLIDYCDGKISEGKTNNELNIIANEIDVINKKNARILESF